AISTSPGAFAVTAPRVSSTIATRASLDDQRMRAPGVVSPEAFRGEPVSVNESPTSTTGGGAKISIIATYGVGPAVRAGLALAPAVDGFTAVRSTSSERRKGAGIESDPSSWRAGSPSPNGAAPNAASACWIDGHRCAGSFANIRNTAS